MSDTPPLESFSEKGSSSPEVSLVTEKERPPPVPWLRGFMEDIVRESIIPRIKGLISLDEEGQARHNRDELRVVFESHYNVTVPKGVWERWIDQMIFEVLSSRVAEGQGRPAFVPTPPPVRQGRRVPPGEFLEPSLGDAMPGQNRMAVDPRIAGFPDMNHDGISMQPPPGFAAGAGQIPSVGNDDVTMM